MKIKPREIPRINTRLLIFTYCFPFSSWSIIQIYSQVAVRVLTYSCLINWLQVFVLPLDIGTDGGGQPSTENEPTIGYGLADIQSLPCIAEPGTVIVYVVHSTDNGSLRGASERVMVSLLDTAEVTRNASHSWIIEVSSMRPLCERWSVIDQLYAPDCTTTGESKYHWISTGWGVGVGGGGGGGGVTPNGTYHSEYEQVIDSIREQVTELHLLRYKYHLSYLCGLAVFSQSISDNLYDITSVLSSKVKAWHHLLRSSSWWSLCIPHKASQPAWQDRSFDQWANS